MAEKTVFKVPGKVPRYKRCETCAWFYPEEPGRMPTTCRVTGPTVIAAPGPAGGMALLGVWPPVMGGDGCKLWEQGSDVNAN